MNNNTNQSNRTLVIVKALHVEIVKTEETAPQEDTERTIEIPEKVGAVTEVTDLKVQLHTANPTETMKTVFSLVIYHLTATGLN